MAVGSFMGYTFTVSDIKVLTPSNLKGSTGSEWATHKRTGAKARSQWIAPSLKRYTLDLLLRAQDGVSPRRTMEKWQQASESAKVDYFVIGGSPLSSLPFKIVSMSDSWDVVLSGGLLTQCMVNLTIEEYA